MTKQERQKYSEAYNRAQKRFERKYLKVVNAALRDQINGFVAVLREDGVTVAVRDMDTVLMNNGIAKAVQDMYKEIGVYFANREYRSLRSQLRTAKKGFGFDLDWIAEIIRYFQLQLLTKAVLPITETTKEQIRQILKEGEEKGWGVDQIVRELNSSELTLWRARMIVRTESQKAAFKGRQMAADKIEYATTTEWIAANDHRTRHSHRRVDGDVVEPGKKFRVPIYEGDHVRGYEEMTGPGDPKASAGNVINCRCTDAKRIVFDEKGLPVEKTGFVISE